MEQVEVVKPDQFEQDNHFYDKSLNSHLHPMVSNFFNLSHKRIVDRYKHINPEVNSEELLKILTDQSKHFFWGGADLFYVTTQSGNRRMVVLETNSCPSG